MPSDKNVDLSKLSLVISFGLVCYSAICQLATIPPRWHASNILDGSWLYSLTRLQLDGGAFGKDVFFTYGPLSQYLGPMVMDGQLPSAPFYVMGIVLMICWGVAWYATLRNTLPLNYFNSLFTLYAMYWVVQRGTLASISDVDAFALIFLIYMAFFTEHEPFSQKILYVSLITVTIIFTQIKFSLGVYAFCAFCLASVTMVTRFGVVSVVFGASTMIVVSYSVFYLSTSSVSLHNFIIQSFHIASMYSEMMALDTWGGRFREFHYFLGVASLTVFVVGHYWVGKCNQLPVVDRIVLLVTGLLCGLIMFRAAYVRADAHVWKLHETMYFGFSIIAASIWSQTPACSESGRKCPMIVYSVILTALLVLPSIFYSEKVTCASSLVEMIKTNGYNCSNNVATEISKQVPELAQELRRRSRRNDNNKNVIPNDEKVCRRNEADIGSPENKNIDRNRIAFIPWEMMFVSLIEGWKLAAIPSLQIYAENQLKSPEFQVRRFLSDANAPEVIVIGDGAIDGRNPVSEATNWLELLIQKYNVTGPYDGYLMAVRKENSDTHIKFFEERNEGPGLLLKLSVDPLDFWSRTAFELSKFFFKPPEIYVEIQFIDGANQIRTSVFRSSESQLEKGIYFSHLPLTRWLALAGEPKNLDASHIIMRVVKAEAVRGNGFRNLKVVSKVRKLEFHHVNILSQ